MIAIHQTEHSFSKRWIEYCKDNKISYKIVDCYSNNIIEDLEGCKGLMWHWHHNDYKAILFARQLTFSLESRGVKIFPSGQTVWHFDDKVGQKYLLESLYLPLVKSYVFYDKASAYDWINNTTFPKVFKLRSGAGAQNVKLIKEKRTANRYVRKAFSSGFSKSGRLNPLLDKVWCFKRDKSFLSFLNIAKGVARVAIPQPDLKKIAREKDYIYAQDFIPGNDSDIRVIIIGHRAFAIKRAVREGDFRASGSGIIKYSTDEIPKECIRIAFDAVDKINSQCLAFDFVFLNDQPLIIEISYGFSTSGYIDCPGYWTRDLKFISGDFTPEYFMIEDFLNIT